MTRGNQRDIDRQRALNRHAGKGESKTGDENLRREADAKALSEKIARKKALEEAVAKGEAPPIQASISRNGNKISNQKMRNV
jgi:hypothetical protein